MADLLVSSLSMVKPVAAPAIDPVQEKRIKQTAQDFEAVLLRQMMREIRGSSLSEAKQGSSANYLSMADEQLANNMAAQGGFGFGKAMAAQMMQQVKAAQLINASAGAVKP
jgi:Rod binding domain-containing protein